MRWSRWEKLLSWGVHEMRHNINGDWEDDRAVVLCRNAVQGLQIAQLSRKKDDLLISDSGRKKTNLKSCRTVHDHFSCHPQGSAGLVFSLGSNHLDAKLSKFKSKSIVLQDYLRSCISGCFCLSSHRPHELFRHPHVFHLKTNDNWLAIDKSPTYLHTLHLNSPSFCCVVQGFLHLSCNCLALREDITKTKRS